MEKQDTRRIEYKKKQRREEIIENIKIWILLFSLFWILWIRLRLGFLIGLK